ncbi:hypothetical protein [Mycobacterium sp. 1274761.0]|uniref:hypothetical protein n=1 Tax=Mycobacterium sp. 1274761.0 TaxID=1834077 RepID=UPI001E5FEDCB|nr:hypothetical protein [Mycobacterium sp. 1274761.0]
MSRIPAVGIPLLVEGVADRVQIAPKREIKEDDMTILKRIAAGALMAAALTAGVLAGAGTASADPHIPWLPDPPGPGILPPPGHLQQLPLVPPPGHWGPVNPGWVNHW